MTNSMNHNHCLHSKDKAGRASCRKAGGPQGHLRKVQADMIASGEALCYDCFWNATDSAMQNLQDALVDGDTDFGWGSFANLDEVGALLSSNMLFDDWFTATAYRWARSYLFDDGALSACSDHADRI